MEVTAAAAQAATYTNSKSLAEQINDYLAATKTSIATLASEIPGYSRPTISRYLSGKYEGDIAAIEKLLADWLAGRTGEDVALPEPGRKTGTKPAFFESRDALKVLGVCQSCQEYIGLGIVVARSGYGKTYSLRQYAKLPRVAYIECDDTMSSRDLVEAIERALGIPSGYGTIWRRVNGIRDYCKAKGIPFYGIEWPSVVVSYANEGERTRIDELKKVIPTKRSHKAAQGDKSLTVDIDLMIVGGIVEDGVEPTK